MLVCSSSFYGQNSTSNNSQSIVYTSEQQKIRVENQNEKLIADKENGGYHLYVKKSPNVNSILLTETTKDPTGKNDSYAYRAKEYNKINGDEKRILNGEFLVSEGAKYSLVDSTPEETDFFGPAFHIYIPQTLVYGYEWSRNGEIQIDKGTFINIRSFEKPYADYTGNYVDNPFMFDFVKIKKPKPKEVVKELPKNRVIVVRDSDTGNPVPYADVNIDDTWDLQSDSAGQVPLPNEIQEGEHKLTVTKGDEYVPTEDVFVVAKGEITSAPQISIPKAVDFKRIKIILDWGDVPWDLDAHVVDGTNHVFFSVKEEGNLELDRDDVNSFGPETITIIEPKKDKVYSYYVHDCSNAGNNESVRLSNSKAQVRVYFDNEFKTSFKITPNKKGLSWHVFDIEDGDKIVKKGKISTKKPSEY
jgi:hypothetical protein